MKKYYIDLAERVAATFVVGFVSALSLTSLSDVKSLEVAAGAAALSGVKAVVAFFKSGGTSASLMQSK